MDMFWRFPLRNMKIPSLKSKKKFLFPVIAGVILIILVVWVFYVLTFIKDVFQGVAGDIEGTQGGAVKFELQKAEDLGIIVGQ